MFKPNEDRVILKPIDPDKETKTGLIIPVEAQKVKIWEVVAIGPSSTDCKTCGNKRNDDLKPGMLAMINENAGMDFEYEDQLFRVVRYSDIHLYE